MCQSCQDHLDYRDLHDDPLTRALMDSDGVSRDELQRLLAGMHAMLMARSNEGYRPGA